MFYSINNITDSPTTETFVLLFNIHPHTGQLSNSNYIINRSHFALVSCIFAECLKGVMFPA